MKRMILFCMMIIVILFYPAYATIINVPADQLTIQSGIDSAITGDTVLVHDGTYTGDGKRDIDFNGKAIFVKSLNGAEYTVIDCEGDEFNNHRGFKFHSGEDSSSVLDGFQIRNGWGLFDGLGGSSAGGAILLESNSSPLISNIIILNCHADGHGGAIFCTDSSPEFINCRIDSNSCDYQGGVVYAINSSPNFTLCSFNDNNSLNSGGCFYLYNSPDVTLNECSFDNNSASSSGGCFVVRDGSWDINLNNCTFINNSGSTSGVLFIQSSSANIYNSSFSNNSATSEGGAIRVIDGVVDIESCIFYENSSNRGGAISAENSSSLSVINSTFFNNSAVDGSSLFAVASSYIIENTIFSFSSLGDAISGGTPTLTCCDIYGNQGGDWVGAIAPQFGINGNFSADPLFCDISENDFHLTVDSPCAPLNNDCSVLIGAYDVYCSGLYAFNLIIPPSDSIYTDTPGQFVWGSANESDTSGEVSYVHILDDNHEFDSPDSSVALADTSYALPDTLARSIQYYWKVLAIQDSATTLLSEETWNFYMDGYPSLPAIINPDTSEYVDEDTYLIWLTSNDPDTFDVVTYTVQIDNNSDFLSPEMDVSGISNSGLVLDEALAQRLGDLAGIENLIEGEIYYWRIRADDAFGLSSEYTDGTNYFTYGDDVNNPPFPPTAGFSPSGDEEIISLTPTITWNDAIDPDPDDITESLIYYFHLIEDTSTGGYEYYDSTAQGINQVTIAEEIPDNSHFLYLVKTVDDEGLESEWSEMQWFWTNHYNYPPEPFSLNTPDPELRWIDYYTYFNWGNTVDYDPMASFDFTLQVSSDSIFNNIVLTRSGITDTSCVMITDTLGIASGNIYWRVLATDEDGLIRYGGLPEPEARLLTIVPPGDVNGDGSVIGSDVTYLVNCFRGLADIPDPRLSGDANADCQLVGSDVTYLVNYFRGLVPTLARGACEPGTLAK